MPADFISIRCAESELDSQNRLKAKAVVIEGLSAQPSAQHKSRSILVTPPQKNALDYLLITVLLASLGWAGFIFYHTSHLEAAAPYAVLLIIAGLALNRQKKPKEKQFSCYGCKAVADFDTRTIQAWNKGILKLYCSTCHQRWLRENPVQAAGYGISRGGGCLGMLCLLVIAPITVGVSLYH